MLKILFVIDSLGRGGTERSLAEMLPFLAEAGIQPLIAHFHRHDQGVEKLVKAQGFALHHINQRGTFARIFNLRRLISAERPHLIHTALFDSDLAGRLAAMGSSRPVLSSLVSTPYEQIRLQDPNLNVTKRKIVRAIDGWTSRHLTTHFHAVSHAAKASAITQLHIRSERITVVERGRDSSLLGQPGVERRRQARAKLGCDEDTEVIVNVGRQEYPKGQIILLRAMQQLSQKQRRVHLFIAGREGNATAELKQYCQKWKLLDQVHFLGHRDDVPDILAAADLFVFPSLYEGMPGAVIEAMALGLPIVASDIPPNREILEERRNSLLVQPLSAEGLAGAIDDLLDNPMCRNEYSRQSRLIFEQRFTLERSVARMIDLFYNVAQRKV